MGKKVSENILRGKKAKKEIIAGINILSNIIGDTLGPRGRNVVIDKSLDYPLITNDGASIAKEIFLTEPFKDIGLNILKEASLKTNELMGDSTTTAIVLADSILKHGKKYLKNGKNPNLLKDEFLNIFKESEKFLESISKTKITPEDIKNLAYISSGNKEYASILKEIFEKGDLNSCFVKEGSSNKTKYIIEEGIMIENGLISPYLNKDNLKNVEIQNPYILIFDGKFEGIKNILNILEDIKKENETILVIAKDFSKEAVKTIVYNNVNNILNIYAVKMPEYFDETKDFFMDLKTVLDSNIYTSNDSLLNLEKKDLVKVKSVRVNKERTYILKEKDDKNLQDLDIKTKKIKEKELEKKKNEILEEIKKSKDKSKKERLKKRLSIYDSKISVIELKDQPDAEKKNSILKLEDAIGTSLSAIKGGALEGGGLAFLKLSKYLEEKRKLEIKNRKDKTNKQNKYKNKEEFKIYLDALKILSKALKEPFKRIVLNAGKKTEKIYKEIKKNNFTKGFDANNFEFVNMIEKGIIDSRLSQLTALENAISISSMILTMSSVIYRNLDYDIN